VDVEKDANEQKVAHCFCDGLRVKFGETCNLTCDPATPNVCEVDGRLVCSSHPCPPHGWRKTCPAVAAAVPADCECKDLGPDLKKFWDCHWLFIVIFLLILVGGFIYLYFFYPRRLCKELADEKERAYDYQLAAQELLKRQGVDNPTNAILTKMDEMKKEAAARKAEAAKKRGTRSP
jgi:hypothetical protein